MDKQSHNPIFPEQVHFCLHQKAADPYEARELVQVCRRYLFPVDFFCAEWKMIREAFQYAQVSIWVYPESMAVC